MPKVKCLVGFRGARPGDEVEVTAEEAQAEAARGARARFVALEANETAPEDAEE